ncbi:MAG: fatty acid CoA ligase FadD9, partial [Mycobacterium sp.]|nr:fatty acid CoA ligase FadD9 [Mycobacterium sp.]
MSIDSREARLERRIADLYSNDEQFAAAKPDQAVAEAAEQPGLRLPDVVRVVMEGYADRPALGQRAVEFVTGADGRTTADLLPRFDTVTYGQLWERVRAAAAALNGQPVQSGDRVAILGFTSVDYAVVDTALTQLGAVSVPLQTSAPLTQLRPIIAETEPSLIASSIDYVADAVELIKSGPAPARLVVFDYRPEVDAQREALESAVAALAASSVTVETLGDVLERGAASNSPSIVAEGPGSDADPLALLVYTSGSTGAPKGAMYPQSKVAHMWRSAANS